MIISFLKYLFKPKYPSLNRVVLRANNLLANLAYLKSLQPTAEMFPVLKSNAYGHGLKEVCQILSQSAVSMVAVDSYPEAQIAYRYFRGQVLIIGEMPLQAYRYCRLKRTEFVVYNEATLQHLARYGKKARIHLFVNSGMNREGIKNLPEFIERNRKYLEQVSVTGLCSHLASADEESILNRNQAEEFSNSLDVLRQAGFFPRWVHLGNSAAIFNLKNKLLTAYRPGLSFYGYSPFLSGDGRLDPEAKTVLEQLRPALEVYSQIISLQDLKFGESVSYNETYRARGNVRVGVVPFGYFEGLDRRLSNQAEFLVKSSHGDFWAKIAGRVCMNLTCLDMDNREARLGTPVQIVSSQPDDKNSIINLASLSGLIPYELLVKIQANIRREIKK